MLTELCDYLKNWFVVSMYYGDFKIADGAITYADGRELPLQIGQHFRITDSIFNNAVYEFGKAEQGMTDETFTGSVWAMAVPPEVLKVGNEIAAWKAKYEGVDSAMMSPFNSESLYGYNYSKSSGADGGGGWQSNPVFKNKLARYRKV